MAEPHIGTEIFKAVRQARLVVDHITCWLRDEEAEDSLASHEF